MGSKCVSSLILLSVYKGDNIWGATDFTFTCSSVRSISLDESWSFLSKLVPVLKIQMSQNKLSGYHYSFFFYSAYR